MLATQVISAEEPSHERSRVDANDALEEADSSNTCLNEVLQTRQQDQQEEVG
jgi:hypothetical protein